MPSIKNTPPDQILRKINDMMSIGEKLTIDRIMVDKYQAKPANMEHFGKYADDITAVFIRYDGWTLAAREKYIEEAHKTWEYEWVCMIRLGFSRAIPLNHDKMKSFMLTYAARKGVKNERIP